MKPNFIPLRELRDSVWPIANNEKLATDLTGVSLPILDYESDNKSHPYCANFFLYYAVPNKKDYSLPDQITRPYAIVTLDLQNGDLVRVKKIKSDSRSNPLIGPGVRDEIHKLEDNDRRNLQDMFFSRYDEIAQLYTEKQVSPDQVEHLDDLLTLFEKLSEPTLAPDYEALGKPFLKWLRGHALGTVKR